MLDEARRLIDRYYDMPEEYRARPGYRYTVVNKQPVLVDRSRRIVEVID